MSHNCELATCLHPEMENCMLCPHYIRKPSKHATNGGYPPIDTGETFLKHKDPNDAPTNSTTENSGGACSYYDTTIKGTTVSCQNSIEELEMDFN